MPEKQIAPPDQKLLVNLVSKIPKEKQKAIAKEIIENHDNDLNSLAEWRKNRDKWYKLWACIRKPKNDPWPGAANACFSLDTDVLTKGGWQKIGDVEVGDYVYTRNEKGEACYKPVTNTIKTHSDALIHFYNQSIDIKVTPEHRMLVQSARTGKTSFYPAKYFLDYKGSGFIPLTSYYIEGSFPSTIHDIDAKAYVRFLGWYISEGCAGYGKTKSGEITTGSFYIAQRLSQKNKHKASILEKDILATKLSYKNSSDRGFTIHARSMTQSIKEELRAIGSCKQKHIPQYILLLHPDLLKELLKTLILGDGHINQRGFSIYSTSSKQLADDIQVLAQKIGIRATISKNKRKSPRNNEIEYSVRLCEQQKRTCLHFVNREKTSGESVACIEVPPYHTLYVRRNNKAMWCGNCIPMLAIAANQFHARAYQSIFAPPGMVKTIPVGKNDVMRANRVEKYLNWQALYEMEEYEEVFDKTLSQLPINGTAFKKLYQSKEKKRVVSEEIHVLDLVLPYRTKSLESARWITQQLWLHYDELQDRDEVGLYENFDAVREVSNATTNDALKDTADKATGERAGQQSDNPHLILECHRKYDLGDGRKPYIFTVDTGSQTLLRVVSREFKVDSEILILNYFTDYHFIPNPEGFFSFGWGHFLEPLNELSNTALNQILDAGRLSNTPWGFYGRRAGFKDKLLSLLPGRMYPVEDASQVSFPQMQRVDMVLFNVLGLIQQYVEQLTSVSDPILGRQTKGVERPTATGTIATIEQGLVTFTVMTKRIFRSLRRELRLLMTLNQIFLPDTKEYRIMGGDDNIAFKDIKREDFSSVYDVVPIGDPSYASRSTKRKEAYEIHNIIMTNPLVTGIPSNKEGEGFLVPPNPAAMRESLKDVLETYEKRNIEKFLPDMPEESIPPDEENSMFAQGDYKSPVLKENHLEHLPNHLEFSKTDYYKKMPKEYKQLLERHIKETQIAIYVSQQSGGGDEPANKSQL